MYHKMCFGGKYILTVSFCFKDQLPQFIPHKSVLTALHVMPAWTTYEKSLCLSGSAVLNYFALPNSLCLTLTYKLAFLDSVVNSRWRLCVFLFVCSLVFSLDLVVQSNPFNITLEGLSILCDIKRSWYSEELLYWSEYQYSALCSTSLYHRQHAVTWLLVHLYCTSHDVMLL